MGQGLLDTGYYGDLLGNPVGIDGKGLYAYMRQDNLSWEEIAAIDSAVVGGMMEELGLDYGFGMGVVGNREKVYRQGAESVVPIAATTQSRPTWYTGQEIGHALPLARFLAGIMLTDYGGRLYTRGAIRAALMNMRDGLRATFDKRIWLRRVSPSEIVHDVGTSVPWVNGTAGSVDYRPPSVRGRTFAASHSHFLRKATLEEGINDMIKTIIEHDHPAGGRINIIVSTADIGSLITGSDYFASYQSAEVQWDRGGETGGGELRIIGEAEYGIAGEVGRWRSQYGPMAIVRATTVYPTNYATAELNYGDMNPDNAISAYYNSERQSGLGPDAIPERHATAIYPFDAIAHNWEYGVGVNMRTQGAAVRVASSGTYSAPTLNI